MKFKKRYTQKEKDWIRLKPDSVLRDGRNYRNKKDFKI